MASFREQILARMQAALLAGSTGAGSNIFRDRETAITRAVSPAIVLMPQTEDAEEFGQAAQHLRFMVAVEIFVRGDPWSQLADPIAVAVQQIFMSDAPLAALVSRLRYRSATWNGEEADHTAGVLVASYEVHYLAKATDPSAAP